MKATKEEQNAAIAQMRQDIEDAKGTVLGRIKKTLKDERPDFPEWSHDRITRWIESAGPALKSSRRFVK